MAATEPIHFPSCVQLSPGHLLPAQILFEPASLIRFNLSRPYGCALICAECSRPPVPSRGGL
jgi:hypothetical protein